MACLNKKAPAPAMIVAAAVLLLLIALLASAPRVQGGGGEVVCGSSIPEACLLGKELAVQTDPNSATLLSDKCCNAFADGKSECLCNLRDKFRGLLGVDPKKPLCPAHTGCPET